MKLSVIIIGDEILIGQVTDTNSGAIARMLGPKGWQMVDTAVIGDDADAIRQALDRALACSDLVITTGGLGPTKDDITKKTLAQYFGCGMRLDQSVLDNVRRIFDVRGLQLNDSTASQAIVPDACRVIQNELGTAPIMWFDAPGGKAVISMPGVPFETVGMLKRRVVDEICARFHSDTLFLHHTIISRGLSESALSEMLEPYEASLPQGMHLAYLPTPGYIRLRLDFSGPLADARALHDCFDSYVDRLRSALGPYLLHDGDATPAEILLDRLRSKHLTLATAESCTGGNIAHCITSVAGSSDTFLGSVVSYANSVKAGLLGVDAADIDRDGAVSETVVRQMAIGACRAIGADCAVATSGIAGPGGAVPGKPVGTVWMAAASPLGCVTKLMHLPGDRQRVIDRATTEAILLLIDNL